jgi:hypothetical protein
MCEEYVADRITYSIAECGHLTFTNLLDCRKSRLRGSSTSANSQRDRRMQPEQISTYPGHHNVRDSAGKPHLKTSRVIPVAGQKLFVDASTRLQCP